jgi:alpha-tubulin suppressor-like RCC1 family protein
MVDSSVACFGANAQGQLGDGAYEGKLTPNPVTLPVGAVVDLAVGFRHTCVALYPASVYCWGENGEGQVGPVELGWSVPDPTAVSLPATAPGDVVDLAAGE